jgi:hypothetical protein
MAKYGTWQRDVLTLAEQILNGEARDENTAFELTGDKAALARFKRGEGQTLHIIPFGNVDLDTFPYFNGANPVARTPDLASVFPLTPAAFKAANTNKPLAIAVAANLAGYSKGVARLLVVSDFLVDANLNEDQQQYVIRFEASTRTETPAIFSWRKDRHVQLKLIHVTPTQPGGADPSATQQPASAGASVTLLSAKLVENPKRVQFAWKASDPTAFQSYSLTVKDMETRKNSFARSSLLGLNAAWPEPPGGKYSWQVIGVTAEGTQVSSASGQIEVPGGGAGAVLGIVAAVAAIVALLWWLNRGRKSGRNKNTED